MNKGSKNASSCDKCNKNADAICFNCNLGFCFQCCINHSQVNTTHNVKHLPQSISLITKRSRELINELLLKQKIEKAKENQKEDSTEKLHPEHFQRYLDEIDFIKKEVQKIIDRFFSELSLEFVNMWENYLLKFTTGVVLIQRIEQLIKWLKPYASLDTLKSPTVEVVKNYNNQKFQEKIGEILNKSVEHQIDVIPECPKVLINERILSEVEQTLCQSISTVNYRFLRKPNYLAINMPDSLEVKKKIVPVFPFKGNFCFLYNVDENDFEIQQFQNIEILPAFPKTIILPNGDLHLIGGVDSDNNLLQTHLVYRQTKAELIKLASLPKAKNPNNALIYANESIYLLGGLKAKNEWDTECFEYSLKKNEWKSIPGMKYTKPHQSITKFRNMIYIFGLSSNQINVNIERFDLNTYKWSEVGLTNFLCNPLNFSAGFSAIQINEDEILLFGGKKYEDSLKSNKRTTDKTLTQNMYIFCPLTSSFIQLEKISLNTGVQFGEINPIIIDNKIYSFQFMLSKINPLVRWFQSVQVIEITNQKQIQCVAIMQQN